MGKGEKGNDSQQSTKTNLEEIAIIKLLSDVHILILGIDINHFETLFAIRGPGVVAIITVLVRSIGFPHRANRLRNLIIAELVNPLRKLTRNEKPPVRENSNNRRKDVRGHHSRLPTSSRSSRARIRDRHHENCDPPPEAAALTYGRPRIYSPSPNAHRRRTRSPYRH